MSSRIFQSVIVQMKEATKRLIGVIDSDGTIVASSELALVGSNIGVFPASAEETGDKVIKSFGRTFKMLGGAGATFDYAVFVDGEDDISKTICIMAFIAISEAKIYYEENHDKCAFVKNIISDNILPGDIYVRAKELHFVTDVPRLVLVIRQVGRSEVTAIELLQNLFPDKQHDFVISVSETDIALIKEVAPAVDTKYVLKLAATVEHKLSEELGLKTVIGIGTPAKHLRELADRYKEAQVAIDVGKVFDTEKTIINYENLGIGRLIYQLPTTLCEMFLSEVFKKNPIESLDQETLYTINKFFENNLNVSETSRKLFVHRNTLVYRLEKIKKLTGLDLREFDHAIVFKVALMVKKYLNSQESKF
ncbi:helix-turn-helix domain-containing protein [Oscillospiraceae bacterium CM]|nr:helix-turn-helix domain-containing protein [Oscillospiraceae bacterium CM]